jgi:hypothetical protein
MPKLGNREKGKGKREPTARGSCLTLTFHPSLITFHSPTGAKRQIGVEYRNALLPPQVVCIQSGAKRM